MVSASTPSIAWVTPAFVRCNGRPPTVNFIRVALCVVLIGSSYSYRSRLGSPEAGRWSPGRIEEFCARYLEFRYALTAGVSLEGDALTSPAPHVRVAAMGRFGFRRRG